jgi:glycine cleavage system regulatory protein
MELIVTVLTDDRPGVIEAVSKVVAAHGGNWQDSRMAQLAGTFAGIIAVAVPDAAADALSEELRGLSGLVVHVARGAEPLPATQIHTLQVVANDRPGIVAEVSRALAGIGVNVAELDTAVEPASMSGGVIFRALLHLGLTPQQSLAEVIAGLEGLSDDLMIDVLGE